MGILIGFHGKLGSGKDEAGRQLRILLGDPSCLEIRAISLNLKVVTSALLRIPLEDLLLQDGKNRVVDVMCLPNTHLLDYAPAVSTLKLFSRFQSIPAEDIEKDMKEMIRADRATRLPVGRILQLLGDGFREVYGDSVWIDMLLQSWSPECNWIITDIRYPNEKSTVKERGGICFKLVGDPKGIRAKSKRDLNHPSETALDGDTKWDGVILNHEDDINNLVRQLAALVQAHSSMLLRTVLQLVPVPQHLSFVKMVSKPKVYIAGPMTGYPEWNFPAFHKASACIRDLGYEPVSPAELHGNAHGEELRRQQEDWEGCMRRAVAALTGCQYIHLLEGWEASRGATMEKFIAEKLGIKPLPCKMSQ